MPIERIAILLEQVSEVEIASEDNTAESAAATEADGASDDLEEALADTPAYRKLVETLESLTPEEVYDLLVATMMGQSDNADDG